MHRDPRRSGSVALLFLCFAAAAATVSAQDVPAVVAIALDTSGGVDADSLLQAGDLARGMLDSLPSNSQLALFSFDDDSRLLLERTSDAEQIVAALESVRPGGSQSALADALFDASAYLRDAPNSRKAILLVTDGRDERSAVRLEDGLELAREAGIAVFTVGVGRANEGVLRRVAKLSGGRYATLEAASGFEIASWILELKPVTVSVRSGTSAAVPTGRRGVPAAGAEVRDARGLSVAALTLLFGMGGLLLVAAGWLAVRRRPVRAARAGPAETDDNATVIARAPEMAPVARTVLLTRRPALQIVEGPGSGARFSLSETKAVSLGRARGNDVLLDHDAVSGEHCRVRPEQGEFVLYDLDSTNGTFVNGRRVSRHALQPGDSIRIGACVLEYRVD